MDFSRQVKEKLYFHNPSVWKFPALRRKRRKKFVHFRRKYSIIRMIHFLHIPVPPLPRAAVSGGTPAVAALRFPFRARNGRRKILE